MKVLDTSFTTSSTALLCFALVENSSGKISCRLQSFPANQSTEQMDETALGQSTAKLGGKISKAVAIATFPAHKEQIEKDWKE